MKEGMGWMWLALIGTPLEGKPTKWIQSAAKAGTGSPFHSNPLPSLSVSPLILFSPSPPLKVFFAGLEESD